MSIGDCQEGWATTMELTSEVVSSMAIGAIFKDFVSNLPILRLVRKVGWCQPFFFRSERSATHFIWSTADGTGATAVARIKPYSGAPFEVPPRVLQSKSNEQQDTRSRWPCTDAFCSPYVQDGRKINSLDFHRTEDRLVTASDDETIRLYDTANAKYVFLLTSMKNRHHHQNGLMICDENLGPGIFTLSCRMMCWFYSVHLFVI